MDILTMAIGFVILPLTLVDIAIGMPELALTIGFILAPLTLISSAIRPHLDSRSMSHLHIQISFVDSSILKGERLNILQSIRLGFLLQLQHELIVSEEELALVGI